MKKLFTFCLCLALFSCVPKKDPSDIDGYLKSAMSDFLNSNARVKGKINYEVKSVTHFEETSYYVCEFKVRMTNAISSNDTPKVDTIGIMKAKIDKNFKVIGRDF